MTLKMEGSSESNMMIMSQVFRTMKPIGCATYWSRPIWHFGLGEQIKCPEVLGKRPPYQHLTTNFKTRTIQSFGHRKSLSIKILDYMHDPIKKSRLSACFFYT